MSAVDLLVSRLDGVRRNGHQRYVAICPAHRDRSPSLSVRDGREGRVLVHCFAGCHVTDVLAAVGLELADLFPERLRELSPLDRAERARLMRESALVAAIGVVDVEASVVAAAVSMLCEGAALSNADHERLTLAMQRISDAREVFA